MLAFDGNKQKRNYKLKSKGPKIDPCGIPRKIFNLVDLNYKPV